MAPQLRIVGAVAASAVLGMATPGLAMHNVETMMAPYPNCAYGNDYQDGRFAYGYGYGYDYMGGSYTNAGENSGPNHSVVDGEAEWTFFGDAHPFCQPVVPPTPVTTPVLTPVVESAVPAPPNYPPPFESPPPPAPLEPPSVDTPVISTPVFTPEPSTTPDVPSGGYAYAYAYASQEDDATCICTIADYNTYVGIMTPIQSQGTYGFINGLALAGSVSGVDLGNFGLNLNLEPCPCSPVVDEGPSPVATPNATPVIVESDDEVEEEAEVEPIATSEVTASFIMSAADLLKTDLADMAEKAAAAARAAAGEGATVVATPVVAVRTEVSSTDPSIECLQMVRTYTELNGLTLPSDALQVTCEENGVMTFDSTKDTLPAARRSRSLLQTTKVFSLATIYPADMKDAAAAQSAVDLSGLCTPSEEFTCGVAPTVMAVEVQMTIIQSMSGGEGINLGDALGDALGDFSQDFAADNGIELVMEELPEIVTEVTEPAPAPEEGETPATPVVVVGDDDAVVPEEDDDWFKVPKDGKDVPVGAIAGGVVGGVVVCGIGAFFVFKRRG